jgi:hypothetical protein
MTAPVALELDTLTHPHPDPATAAGRSQADHGTGRLGNADAEAAPR